MSEAGEKQISGAMTFFCKFFVPPVFLILLLAWTTNVAFVSGIQHRGPSPTMSIPGVLGFCWCLFYFSHYYFPLKEVRLGERDLRVSNLRRTVGIPLEAIEAIKQQTNSNDHVVVVTLRVDTPFGRRFTFLPLNAKFVRWPFARGEDEVVTELRGRVQVARKEGKSPSKPDAVLGRSPMVDAELDGPF